MGHSWHSFWKKNFPRSEVQYTYSMWHEERNMSNFCNSNSNNIYSVCDIFSLKQATVLVNKNKLTTYYIAFKMQKFIKWGKSTFQANKITGSKAFVKVGKLFVSEDTEIRGKCCRENILIHFKYIFLLLLSCIKSTLSIIFRGFFLIK